MSKIIKSISTIKYIAVYTLILLAILALGAIMFMAKDVSADEVATYQPYNQPNPVQAEVSDDTNPKPAVSSLSPSSANVGSGPRTITITGTGFIPESVARFNGSDRNTTFVDSSHLLVNLTGADMEGSSGRYITVWNPAPAGGYSNGSLFSIKGYVDPSQKSISQTTNTAPSTATVSSTSTKRTTTSTRSNGSVLGTQNSNQQDENFSSLAGNAVYGSNSFLPSGIIQWLLIAIFILILMIIVRKIFFADKYNSTPMKHA